MRFIKRWNASYFLERLKLNHRPATIGTASASQAAQCHAPVFNNAASKPNIVNIANMIGARQTNQKLLRGVELLVIASFQMKRLCIVAAFNNPYHNKAVALPGGTALLIVIPESLRKNRQGLRTLIADDCGER